MEELSVSKHGGCQDEASQESSKNKEERGKSQRVLNLPIPPGIKQYKNTREFIMDNLLGKTKNDPQKYSINAKDDNSGF